MLFNICLLPLLISAATAFVLPGGLTDGVYRAYTDEHGVEIHERASGPSAGAIVSSGPATRDISADISADSNETHGLSKRRLPGQHWCGCGFTLNHQDCDSAVADIKNQVGSGVHIQAHRAYYSIRGSVIFFACNTGDGQLYMDVPSVTDIAGSLTEVCGRYIAGTYARLGYPPEASGYMRYSQGLDFCAAAKTSPASSC